MTNLSTQIEGDLIAMLDEWHSLPETWDHELDAQIHRWYSDVPTVWPKRPYFSPSSLNDCPRELYLKAKRAKRDIGGQPPHQKRWQNAGTLVGDMIQRDLLFIEKHFEAKTGNAPRFRFLRDKQGRPAFEDFAKINRKVEYEGETFYLYGAPDGIMEYVTDDGEKVRVGIEIKSKQTTAAQTSLYSMREPTRSHFVQTVAYAEMYDCDYYVILYVNLSKKGWYMSDEDYEKTPDIRAFCTRITDEHKAQVFGKAAAVTKAVREGKPPKLDIEGWTFNGFKEACALDLSGEEVEELRRTAEQAKHSSLPRWKINSYVRAVDEIEELRKEAE